MIIKEAYEYLPPSLQKSMFTHDKWATRAKNVLARSNLKPTTRTRVLKEYNYHCASIGRLVIIGHRILEDRKKHIGPLV